MIKTIRTFAERVMDAYMQMDWEQVYRLEHTDEFGREFPQVHVEPPKQTAELNKPYMSETAWADPDKEGVVRGYN